jgi:hypothetical protein
MVGSNAQMPTFAVRGLGLLALVACVGGGSPWAGSGRAAAPTPRAIAIVGLADRARLVPVDARTLMPLPGAWSVPVPVAGPAALSPSGKKAAVQTQFASAGPVLVVDTATGRVEHTYPVGGDTSDGLYWFDRNEARPFILAIGFGCGSTGVDTCGAELSVVGVGDATDYGDTDTGPALKEGVVLIFDPTSIDVYHDESRDIAIDLPRMPPSAPFAVVADVSRDRLFEISSGGLVAEIDHVAKKPSISYHGVDLNGNEFQATWAGGGKIALWGRDGLGMIDTRTWTTQAIAPDVTGALATPLGLATWTNDPADGLTVYRPDGSARFHVLIGKLTKSITPSAITAFGNYLYVRSGEYSVDLRTGKVLGPLPNHAKVITPSLVPIH